MLKRTLLGLLCGMLLAGTAVGQGVCPLKGTLSKDLICLIPQVYGPFGLSNGGPLLTAHGHEAHFENDFVAQFRPISEAVGTQISGLPKASPSSGITFVYDPALKTFTPATEQTLGPILGERADTIGRHGVYVGFSYQYFNFDRIDGTALNNIPAVFEHQPLLANNTTTFPCGSQVGFPPAYAGDSCAVRDFIQTTNSIDLKVHQYTLYATYGITRNLDVSVAIPILNVQMNVRSDATIVSNSFADAAAGFPGNVFHQFDTAKVPSCGATVPCLHGLFSDSGSARGIGDVVFRGKYQMYKGERAGVAVGVEVRTPTGDERNFLGSGAVGVKPFVVFSYRARVSPHVELASEVNGDSILAGDFVGSANTSAALPNRFIYIAGADAAINKHLTAAFDLYGQHLIDAVRLVSTPFTDFGSCNDFACDVLTPGTAHPNVSGITSGSNLLDASLGLKVRAFGKLVLTGNVLLKLNDDGLRAKAAPLVGVGYSF